METTMLPSIRTSPAIEVVHTPPSGIGTRPPLLFVHGLAHGAWCWRNWMEAAAAAGHPAYALSFRGHGGSEGRAAGARLSDYVADTVRVVSSISEGHVVLVGHSLGGLVVQHVLPKIDAAAAVLLATIPHRPAIRTALSVVRNDPIQGLRMATGRPIHLGPEMLFHGLDPSAATAAMTRMVPDSALVQLQLLLRIPARRPSKPIPVLSVAGVEDRVVPIGSTRATARRYRADTRDLEGIGHDSMLDVGWPEAWATIDQWLLSQGS
ncbi:alpha/beta hydrolase [Actinomycetes bacterium M1A6_2h]